VLFHLTIVLSVRLRFTASDYAFDVFKFFATPESSILGQVTPIFGSGFNVTKNSQMLREKNVLINFYHCHF
jgi:hypothetical protein